ncbi:hypothetical protein C8046_10705 [Serinibacter arcticus]|uniref:PIN domain-containing protein n=1 Tax=Serinibacter arcticus TaxID=1655435 RepID=A0A2U1ZVP0_9MICO|nr:hypothetical protein [Serinibacter arcticus]PWD51048.1 hypothetical protein C8046_10705 [Serinibacter arcticus]
MTRIAIDADVALRLVREGVRIRPEQHLVGPAVLRSHALQELYRAVRAGELADAEGRRLLEGLAGLKIRLLGDRVSRAVAWRIAAQLDRDDTALAEYLAVAQLQSDLLVTADPALAAAAEGIVAVGTWDDHFGPRG